ncbi:MAG TPA: hypothetical protein VGJ27_02675 [Gaiellaceae bacterium]
MATSLHGELEERRAHACRLSPDHALESLAEAEAFVRERGIVTLTPSSSLPSLYGACHEEPYTPGGKGFGAYPRTKWPWGWELRERPGIHWLRLLRGTGVFLIDAVAAFADPLCREELARAEEGAHGKEPARLVAHLGTAGPSLLDEVKEELGLSAAALKKARAPLERVGSIVAREVVLEHEGRHRHTSELRRWDQLEPAVEAAPGGVGALLASGVRAAVLAPEREARTWFTWPASLELVEELVAEGRLVRPEPGWLATP